MEQARRAKQMAVSPTHYYVIQRRATAHEDWWLTMRGKYATAEEAWSEFDRRYGKSDFSAADHRVMEVTVTTSYRKVKR